VWHKEWYEIQIQEWYEIKIHQMRNPNMELERVKAHRG
jgi:hypothetical protein